MVKINRRSKVRTKLRHADTSAAAGAGTAQDAAAAPAGDNPSITHRPYLGSRVGNPPQPWDCINEFTTDMQDECTNEINNNGLPYSKTHCLFGVLDKEKNPVFNAIVQIEQEMRYALQQIKDAASTIYSDIYNSSHESQLSSILNKIDIWGMTDGTQLSSFPSDGNGFTSQMLGKYVTTIGTAGNFTVSDDLTKFLLQLAATIQFIMDSILYGDFSKINKKTDVPDLLASLISTVEDLIELQGIQSTESSTSSPATPVEVAAKYALPVWLNWLSPTSTLDPQLLNPADLTGNNSGNRTIALQLAMATFCSNIKLSGNTALIEKIANIIKMQLSLDVLIKYENELVEQLNKGGLGGYQINELVKLVKDLNATDNDPITQLERLFNISNAELSDIDTAHRLAGDTLSGAVPGLFALDMALSENLVTRNWDYTGITSNPSAEIGDTHIMYSTCMPLFVNMFQWVYHDYWICCPDRLDRPSQNVIEAVDGMFKKFDINKYPDGVPSEPAGSSLYDVFIHKIIRALDRGQSFPCTPSFNELYYSLGSAYLLSQTIISKCCNYKENMKSLQLIEVSTCFNRVDGLIEKLLITKIGRDVKCELGLTPNIELPIYLNNLNSSMVTLVSGSDGSDPTGATDWFSAEGIAPGTTGAGKMIGTMGNQWHSLLTNSAVGTYFPRYIKDRAFKDLNMITTNIPDPTTNKEANFCSDSCQFLETSWGTYANPINNNSFMFDPIVYSASNPGPAVPKGDNKNTSAWFQTTIKGLIEDCWNGVGPSGGNPKFELDCGKPIEYTLSTNKFTQDRMAKSMCQGLDGAGDVDTSGQTPNNCGQTLCWQTLLVGGYLGNTAQCSNVCSDKSRLIISHCNVDQSFLETHYLGFSGLNPTETNTADISNTVPCFFGDTPGFTMYQNLCGARSLDVEAYFVIVNSDVDSAVLQSPQLSTNKDKNPIDNKFCGGLSMNKGVSIKSPMIATDKDTNIKQVTNGFIQTPFSAMHGNLISGTLGVKYACNGSNAMEPSAQNYCGFITDTWATECEPEVEAAEEAGEAAEEAGEAADEAAEEAEEAVEEANEAVEEANEEIAEANDAADEAAQANEAADEAAADEAEGAEEAADEAAEDAEEAADEAAEDAEDAAEEDAAN